MKCITAKLYDGTENQNLDLEVEFSFQRFICHSGRVTSQNICKSFLNLLRLLPETHPHSQEKKISIRINVVYLFKKSWQGTHLQKFLSNASVKLFPDNTLRSLAFFVVATEFGGPLGSCSFGIVLHINQPKCYRGKIDVFWQENFELDGVYHVEPRLIFRLPTLWPWTHSFKKDKIKQKFLSQSKCQKQRKMLRFTSQINNRVGHSVVRISDTFLEALFAKVLFSFWEKKDPTSQCLILLLSAYLLSWSTETWLSEKTLTTQRLHCCAAFFSFPN